MASAALRNMDQNRNTTNLAAAPDLGQKSSKFRAPVVNSKHNENAHVSVFRSKIPIFSARPEKPVSAKKVLAPSKPQQSSKQPLKEVKQAKNVQTAPTIQQKQAPPKPVAAEPAPKPIALKVEDIDAEPNPLLLSDYAVDIYRYLRKLEKEQTVKANFLSRHNCCTGPMRAVLVNWLFGIHRTFRMQPETLYLSVSILNRYLYWERVEKSQLQLVACTSMFIASKFEEVYYPDVSDFVMLCDNLYTKRDILRMEIRMLEVLDFQLSGPCPLHFLRRASKAAHADARVHMMGKYLCELSLMDYQCAHLMPSLIAATALFVALILTNSNDDDPEVRQAKEAELWTPTIEHYSGYSLADVRKHAAVICRVVISAETSKHQNCRNKYKSSSHMSVSHFSPKSASIIKRLASATTASSATC